jgi:translation initiation factor IF-3
MEIFLRALSASDALDVRINTAMPFLEEKEGLRVSLMRRGR